MGLTEKRFREIVNKLPKKDRNQLQLKDLDEATLEQMIRDSEDAMKRDLWVGIPWFVMYTSSLIVFGFTSLTVTLLVIGVIYFVYSYVKFGSYGMNRVRVSVYKQLLEDL
ncbi:MAG: hypothetical protein GYB31_20945 [Bacteroidetes bacterium]|nr:hypothetical protein [Bacteroidota bacterium]